MNRGPWIRRSQKDPLSAARLAARGLAASDLAASDLAVRGLGVRALAAPAWRLAALAAVCGWGLGVGAARAEVAIAPGVFLEGLVEAYHQQNLNRPGSGVTALRGFDQRHGTFTLQSVVLGARWDTPAVVGRLALQFGGTSASYYGGEPVADAAGGAGGTGPELWRMVQEAWLGHRFDVGGGLLLSLGTFLSPVGPEGINVRDNWNWSRSNLFYGLPFYHTGARLAWTPSERWTLTLGALNGWNSVVDGNADQSVLVRAEYTVPEALAVSVLYLGGVERSPGAAEGQPWRHLFDAHARWSLSDRWALLGHVNGGFERTDLGTARWFAAALAARGGLPADFFVAGQVDAFWEWVPERAGTRAAALFWPVAAGPGADTATRLTSGTLTLGWQPVETFAVRLEARHDRANGDFFAEGGGDRAPTAPFEPRSDGQTTFTLGLNGGF